LDYLGKQSKESEIKSKINEQREVNKKERN